MATMPREIGNEFNASAIKFLFEELFGDTHSHRVRSTFPTVNEGSPRDIAIVDDGSAVYICVKTSRGWFQTVALTAV